MYMPKSRVKFAKQTLLLELCSRRFLLCIAKRVTVNEVNSSFSGVLLLSYHKMNRKSWEKQKVYRFLRI